MIVDLHLEPHPWARNRAEPLHFIWNSETGELGSEAKARLGERLRLSVEHGSISADPVPCSIDFDDPWHKPEQMVVFLAHDYRLPAELMRHYPKFDYQWRPDVLY
ncbi:hypothetical protein ACKVEX_05655 [Rhodocyclaceae bacterium SMB388]